MPQWRKLPVSILECDQLSSMPDDFTRLVWLLLPLILDREGRCRDNPVLVRSRLFPTRLDVTVELLAAALDWLLDRGLIVRYTSGGLDYFHVPGFRDVQGDTSREAPSRYPPPPAPLLGAPADEGKEDVDVREPAANPGPPAQEPPPSSSRGAPEYSASLSRPDADADSNTQGKAGAESIPLSSRPARLSANARRKDGFPKKVRELEGIYQRLTGLAPGPAVWPEIEHLAGRGISIGLLVECCRVVEERMAGGQRILMPWRYCLAMAENSQQTRSRPGTLTGPPAQRSRTLLPKPCPDCRAAPCCCRREPAPAWQTAWHRLLEDLGRFRLAHLFRGAEVLGMEGERLRVRPAPVGAAWMRAKPALLERLQPFPLDVELPAAGEAAGAAVP